VETRAFRDLRFSTLVLGTVQLGLPYGIANTTGQPAFLDVLDILSAAVEGGVTCLDTAAVYGESETVLGKALAELGLTDTMIVATKVTQLAAEGISARQADGIVEQSVLRSLRNLRRDRLDLCLFHLEGNFLLYADSLLKMREKGLVRYVGSSVNFPGPAAEILRTGRAEALQMPTSILDHRFLRAGIPALAAGCNAALFVRSIYLQGLLLMPEASIPAEQAAVIPVRHALESIAADAGMGLRELAVRHMLSVPGITALVVGVETAQQMRDNVTLFGKGPLDDALRARVDQAVPDLPDAILFPGTWAKKMTVKPVTGGSS